TSTSGTRTSGSWTPSTASALIHSRSASMPRLIKRGAVIDDGYALLREAPSITDVPEATQVIVPLALWNAARAVLIARGDAGVWLAPSDDPAAIATDVKLIPVIAIDFPKFTDGRGYSI